MNPGLLVEKDAELDIDLDVGTLLAGRILAKLGRPANLARVDTRHLWADNFRVNVYVDAGETHRVPTVRIADSFFVQLTQEGITCSPAISRKYA